MRIGLAYNQRPDDFEEQLRDAGANATSSPADDFVEWDEPDTIAAVEDALLAFGEVIRLEAVRDFPWRLARSRIDLLFNMAEGARGPSREAHVPAIAEFLGIPYTASDPLTLALSLHKARTKECLLQRAVPTPPFMVVATEADLAKLKAFSSYPAFLKPVWEGSSKGIGEENYCASAREARRRARQLLRTYREPVLVEAYLPGHEFTAAILGNGPEAECLPLIRYRFEGLPKGALPIMGREAKWIWDRPDEPLDILECPARIPAALRRAVEEAALAAYHALGCRDWARVDLRLDGSGGPQVMEINPLPGIIPDLAANSCFPLAAARAGIAYPELIQRVVAAAWNRTTGEELSVPTLAGAAT